METIPLFEGPEKKLEIILFAHRPGIRDNADGRWRRVVEASRAEIISSVATERMDAYLLSESSLFVWDDRILMITCGKTTLVRALPAIADIVGKENVAFVFYEQKNFLFPHEQPSTFEQNVSRITGHFPGKYYRLGPGNYDHVNIFYSSHATDTPEGDATLQLLMHHLDADAMAPFCSGDKGDAEGVARDSGLGRLYPGAFKLDAYLFHPCGYSLNGVAGDTYYTVHVTPQQKGSYVSFETNIFEHDYAATIRQVIGLFRPGRFSVMLTTSMDDACIKAHDTVVDAVPGYMATDKSFYELDCGYSITFLNYLQGVKE